MKQSKSNLRSAEHDTLPDEAEDVVIASLGTMTRGSRAMFERRRRVLREARVLLEENGVEALNMRALAERSGVAVRTLYNVFGGKEVLISTAIRQYYDKFLRRISTGSDPCDFEWVLSTLIAVNLRNQQIRNYLSALVGLYFSVTVKGQIRDELQRFAGGFMRPWLEVARARRQLRPGTDLDRIVINIANLQFAINQEWLAGHLSESAFIPAIVDGVLTYLIGVTRGDTKALIEQRSSLLQGDTDTLSVRIRHETQRISALLTRHADRPG